MQTPAAKGREFSRLCGWLVVAFQRAKLQLQTKGAGFYSSGSYRAIFPVQTPPVLFWTSVLELRGYIVHLSITVSIGKFSDPAQKSLKIPQALTFSLSQLNLASASAKFSRTLGLISSRSNSG